MRHFVSSHAVALFVLALVQPPALAQEERTARVLAEVHRAMDARRETQGLHEACTEAPDIVVPALMPYLRDQDYQTRSQAFGLLCMYDKARKAEHVLAGLEIDPPLADAILVARDMNWSNLDPDLYARLRKVLHRLSKDDTVPSAYARQSALTLGAVGQVEDLVVLREGLSLVNAKRIRLEDADDSAGLEGDYRQAMARLGDEEQLEYFREQLASQDRKRVKKALERAVYIRHPELASSVVAWINEPVDVSREHGQMSIAWFANVALRETFPDVAATIPRGQDIEFWNAWAKGRGEASELRTGDPPGGEESATEPVPSNVQVKSDRPSAGGDDAAPAEGGHGSAGSQDWVVVLAGVIVLGVAIFGVYAFLKLRSRLTR